MSRTLQNRLSKLETHLGIEDEQDDGFEIISAERRLAAHQAFTEMLRGLVSDEELARQDAAFEPGPRRVRKLKPETCRWVDEMLASRGDGAREVQIVSQRAFDPTEAKPEPSRLSAMYVATVASPEEPRDGSKA